jgi:hypothetical protein
MNKLLVLVILILVSCNEERSISEIKEEMELKDAVEDARRHTDSVEAAVSKNVDASSELLEIVNYLKLNMDFRDKARDAEIMYYRTGKEKYKTLYSRYVDSTNKYYYILQTYKSK